MTPEQISLLHNLPMNGGRLSLSIHRREEFAEMEQNGWLKYRHGDLLPYMEITPEGTRACDEARYARFVAANATTATDTPAPRQPASSRAS